MLKSRGEMGEPWGGPRHRVGDHPVLEHPHPEPGSDQLQHLAVTHPSGHLGHQGLVIKIAEGVRDVGFEHPVGSPVGLDSNLVQGMVHAASWAVAEARRQEVRFPDGLQEQFCRRHGRSVPTGGYAERPELARLPGLGDLDSPQRGGPVGPLLQVLGDVFKEGFHSGGLDVVDADAVDTGSPSVFTDLAPGPGKHVAAGDLVEEGMELASRVLLGTAVERVGEGSGPGWALAPPVSSGISLVRHSPIPSLQLRASMK